MGFFNTQSSCVGRKTYKAVARLTRLCLEVNWRKPSCDSIIHGDVKMTSLLTTNELKFVDIGELP